MSLKLNILRPLTNIPTRAPKNRPLHLHAVKSGNLAVILAFRQDRANRLPEQTQRRAYGGAARARRHSGGIVKIFHWEGEP